MSDDYQAGEPAEEAARDMEKGLDDDMLDDIIEEENPPEEITNSARKE